MGLKLAEIRELLEIQDRGACPCGHTKTIVERHLEEIDAELECSATTAGTVWNCEVEFKKGGEQ